MSTLSFKSHSSRRRLLAAAVSALAILIQESIARAAGVQSNWLTPVSGSWADPSKWSSPNYPNNGNPVGTTYDAVIGASDGAYTVSLDAAAEPAGTLTVDSVTLNSANATLSLTSGALQCLTGLTLNAGTLSLPQNTRLLNTTISGTGGQIFARGDGFFGGTFDHVTFARDMLIGDNSSAFFQNGVTLNQTTLTLSGENEFRYAQTIGGTGTIAMTAYTTMPKLYADGGVLTIGSGITLAGGGEIWCFGNGSIVNNGTVRANADFNPLRFPLGGNSIPMVNNGLIEVTSNHTVILSEIAIDNTNGIIRAAGGHAIVGYLGAGQVGTLETSNGGVITLLKVDNTGHTITAGPSAGVIELNDVTGGTLATTGGAEFDCGPDTTFNNTTLSGSLCLRPTSSPAVWATLNNLRLGGGTVSLFGGGTAYADFRIGSGGTLSGTGSVVFEGGSELKNELYAVNGAQFALTSGITVRTGSGGGILFDVLNEGTISAQTPGHSIQFSKGVNAGKIVATNGSSVTFALSTTNHGTISATAGGIVTLGDAWTSDRSITAGGTSTLNLNGTWSNTGPITVNDSTLNTDGTWNNTGAVIASNSTVNLGGAFKTASLASFTRSGGIVNLTGALDNASTSLALNAGTGTWNLTSAGKITGGSLTTAGGAKLLGQGTNARLESVNVLGAVDVPVGVTLFNSTVGNGGSVSTGPGSGVIAMSGGSVAVGGNIAVKAGATFNPTDSWSSAGDISSDGGTLHLFGNWSNNGSISAVSLGLIETGGTWSNAGTISGTGANARLGGTPTILGSVAFTDTNIDIAGQFTTPQLLAIGRTNSPIALVSGANLVNTGNTLTISPSFPLQVKGGTIVGGTVDAAGGSTVVIPTPATATLNAVTLQTTLNLQSGAQLVLSGAWDNKGSIVAQNATVSLGGTFARSNIGTIQRTGGAVRITGVMDNSASTFTIDNVGTWTLSGGKIAGGTVNAPAGTSLGVSTSATLSGVTFSGTISIAQFGSLSSENGLTLAPSAVVGLASNARAVFTGTQTLAGNGELVFNGTTGSVGPTGTGSTLTIQPGITVRSGTNGGSVGAGGLSTVNKGLISSRTTGQVISLLGTITNEGMIEARNGGTISRSISPSATITNLSGSTLTGGTWAAYAASTMNFGSGVSITTNAADVTLSGVGSIFTAINSLANNTGTFTVTSGRDFTTAAALSNSGRLVVGQGSDLLISGNLGASNSASLAMELGDDATSAGYGQVVVTGTANLAGRLEVLLASGQHIEVGDTYTVLSGGARSGLFDAIIWPAGVSGDVTYSSTAVQLTLTSVPEPTSLTLFGILWAARGTRRGSASAARRNSASTRRTTPCHRPDLD